MDEEKKEGQHICDESCGCGPITCLCGGESVCKYNEGVTDTTKSGVEDEEATVANSLDEKEKEEEEKYAD